MATIVMTNIIVKKLTTGIIEVKVVPPVTRVPNKGDSNEAILEWLLTGGTFVEPAFNWKNIEGTFLPPSVSPVSATRLESARYLKTTTPEETVSWEYEFTVKLDGESTTLLIDPEVENLPPGYPVGYKRGKSGERGKPGEPGQPGGEPGGQPGQPGKPGNVTP